jgi:hypothetical protein
MQSRTRVGLAGRTCCSTPRSSAKYTLFSSVMWLALCALLILSLRSLPPDKWRESTGLSLSWYICVCVVCVSHIRVCQPSVHVPCDEAHGKRARACLCTLSVCDRHQMQVHQQFLSCVRVCEISALVDTSMHISSSIRDFKPASLVSHQRILIKPEEATQCSHLRGTYIFVVLHHLCAVHCSSRPVACRHGDADAPKAHVRTCESAVGSGMTKSAAL